MKQSKNNFNIIKYLYEHGSYSIDKMCSLVRSNEISKMEFYEITRLHYDSLKERN